MNSSHPLKVLVPILASLVAFAPLSIDMYLPAFPQIAADLGVPVAKIELSLATFFIGLSVGQLFYGRRRTASGVKSLYMWGLWSTASHRSSVPFRRMWKR